ncbi:MAG TPA: VC0807 family protein [Pseudonocardiaceae bacterium]|jgi:hypothetical protein|nr:VC0807 family protein [Pseudonocardiaceae bacterium]
MSATTTQPGQPGRAATNPLAALVLDVGLPLGTYYLLQHLGVSLVTSLAISGLTSVVRVLHSVVRERRADGLAIAVLVLTAISIPVAFLTGSPQVMLAKESLGTGPLGIWLIVSALIGKPAMANGARAFLARAPNRAGAWEHLITHSAAFRSCANAMTVVWGVGFLIECAVRAMIVFTLPVQTAVWAVNIPMVVAIIGCIAVQSRWTMRMERMIRQQVEQTERDTTVLPVAA